VPGGDPEFSREQLLDAYGIDYAILNPFNALIAPTTGGNQPRAFSDAMLRATNDWLSDKWLAADPRWLGSIATHFDDPASAVDEIERIVTSSDRWAQIILPLTMSAPLGNPRYRSILEAAVEHGLPVGMHVTNGAQTATHFYDYHVSHPLGAYAHLASLVFEGVFDELPHLKIVFIEPNWSWIAPFAWRLDATWRVLRDEVPDLQRKPSEYVGEHVWVTTQPAEEPEKKQWFHDAYRQFSRLSGANHMMFTTDYPHWDFDSPLEAVPSGLTPETRELLMWQTAAELYGLQF
jgi:predicted TIM-barrel fold metal-dependent hydrolase